jgi:hypothetical protein
MYKIQLPKINEISTKNNNTIKGFPELKENLNKEKKAFDKIQNLSMYYTMLNKNNPYYELTNVLKEKLNNINVTNGFIKLYEINAEFKLYNKDVTAFFLAEFPGSFIMSMMEFCSQHKIKYNWLANSYMDETGKTNYLADQFKYYKNNPDKWMFGSYGNGDVTLIDNIRSFKQDIVKYPPIIYMTGDAKFVEKEEDWDKEEEDNVNVLTGEVINILNILSIGGNAIIKFFTFCEIPTIYLLYLLSYHFESVYITKPLTSRPANSEIYIICLNKTKELLQSLHDLIYKKNTSKIFKIPSSFCQIIPNEFITFLRNVEEELMNKQIKALKQQLTMKHEPYDGSLIKQWLEKVNIGENKS